MPSPPPSAVFPTAVPLSRLAGVTGAVGCPDPAPVVTGVATDSRTVAPGALFVALRGAAQDGHAYLAEAHARGAGALLIDVAAAAAGQAPPPDVPCLVVPDTTQALGQMGAAWRRDFTGPTVAVTGSNGKTSTCALVAAALSAGGVVHRTAGNLNNHVGVPLTLLGRPADAWAQVVEMGMSAPGEIAHLVQLAAPQVSVVTCVDVAHLGGPGLGSLAAIARAKAEVYGRLGAGDAAVINLDDTHLAGALPTTWPEGVRRIGFGRAAAAQVRLVEAAVTRAGTRVVLQAEGRAWPVLLPLLGAHHGMNAAAAGAAAMAVSVPAATWTRGLLSASAPPGRCQLRQAGGVTLVDDTYNANPGSLRAAGRLLVELADARRRILVTGDMGELGPRAAELHAEAGVWLAGLGLDAIFTCGPLSAHLADGARQAGARVWAHADTDAVCRALDGALVDGDVVLVKGSRSARMERVADHIWRRAGRDA